MKNVYPVLITKDNNAYLVYVPDINRMTQGASLYEAICMARDLLGTWSLDAPLPEPSDVKEAVRIAEEKADDEEFTWSKGEPVFVDIDTDEYRRRLNTKAVKKFDNISQALFSENGRVSCFAWQATTKTGETLPFCF